MKKNLDLKNIPTKIPVFPLANAIFFPNTLLPLNIFEPRYKQMTEHALSNHKMIGMVQTKSAVTVNKKVEVFKIGCLGVIENHEKTPDGRYLINLQGIVRFKILNEIETDNLYRSFEVAYDQFSSDLDKTKEMEEIKINKFDLLDKTKKFFKMHQLSTDWKVVEKVKSSQLINSLAMICPFTVGEKQRLLETYSLEERNEVLQQIINFYILGNHQNNKTLN